MTKMIRLTTYPGKRTVYRSSITGKFVSKSHYLDNPDTTYKSTVRTPRYEWVYPEELLYGFQEIQFHDSTDPLWLVSLQQPIRMTELSTVCDKVGVPFDEIIKTLHDLPYWRNSLRVDVHEFKKQGKGKTMPYQPMVFTCALHNKPAIRLLNSSEFYHTPDTGAPCRSNAFILGFTVISRDEAVVMGDTYHTTH